MRDPQITALVNEVRKANGFADPDANAADDDKLREFIGRNYEVDASGCWYFQNGPQQVFVELEIAPWVLRLRRDAAGALHVETHTGRPLETDAVRAALVDEQGRLFLDTMIGLGLVASADMDLAADEVLAGRWQPEEVDSATLPARCGHVLSPARA